MCVWCVECVCILKYKRHYTRQGWPQQNTTFRPVIERTCRQLVHKVITVAILEVQCLQPYLYTHSSPTTQHKKNLWKGLTTTDYTHIASSHRYTVTEEYHHNDIHSLHRLLRVKVLH